MLCPRHEAECDEHCGSAGERCRVERPKVRCFGTVRLVALGPDGEPCGMPLEVELAEPMTFTVSPE
jgi:hypothetical protein